LSAAQLIDPAAVYVNDGFGSAHRAHASAEGVAQVMKARGARAVAGFPLEWELDYLRGALQNLAHSFMAIIVGARISGMVDMTDNSVVHHRDPSVAKLT
jgi:phosphoglycerate kinase